MKLKTKLLTISALIASTVSMGSYATTLRLADTMPQGVPNSKGLYYFADKVNEYSEGEVTIKIFSNGILGTERENVEQLGQGVIDMARVGAATLDSFTDSVKPVTLPYVFDNTNHMIRALNGDAGKTLFNAMEQDGIYPLTYFTVGARSFYTKEKAITKPEDLAGLKIRVMNSQMAIDTMNLLGASPTPLPMGDVYSALQQGVIDGAENAPQALTEHGHGNVSSYFSFDEHFNYPEFILISKTAKAKLSAEELAIVERAAKEASEYEVKLAQKAVDHAIEEAGDMVKFNQVDKAPFIEKVQPLYTKLEAESDYAKTLLKEIDAAK